MSWLISISLNVVKIAAVFCASTRRSAMRCRIVDIGSRSTSSPKEVLAPAPEWVSGRAVTRGGFAAGGVTSCPPDSTLGSAENTSAFVKRPPFPVPSIVSDSDFFQLTILRTAGLKSYRGWQPGEEPQGEVWRLLFIAVGTAGGRRCRCLARCGSHCCGRSAFRFRIDFADHRADFYHITRFRFRVQNAAGFGDDLDAGFVCFQNQENVIAFTDSPSFFSHSEIVASVMDSPTAGTLTCIFMARVPLKL